MSNSAINTQVAQLKIGNVQNQADNSAVYSGGVWSLKNSTALTSVTITDSGNVGIGTASPSQKLVVSNAGAQGIEVIPWDAGSGFSYIQGYNRTTSAAVPFALLGSELRFWSGGTERMRIDASGNVGIGTASPIGTLTVGSNDTNAVITSGGANTHLTLAAVGSAGAVIFGAGGVANGVKGTERMRIDASGNLLVGTTSGSANTIQHPTQSQGNQNLLVTNCAQFFVASGGFGNAAACSIRTNGNTTTSRSINASGSINANGADYAEYMTKAGDFTIAKGEICGVNSEGKLTKTFSEAVAFMVKSTNPSYVGNDSWGEGLEADSEELEAARQLVDRIAFCGQIPVNVLGATPGQWIIPVENNGGIKGEAVSSPSFEQYQKAVGKVIAIEEDGRARIIVKIA